ncbi:type II secretion system F family protein [Nocardioides sp.]|uniref:type II secretion system F family protein n=1 Tax=Nocardioides sp. TaxID=35761 RepID=UPI0035121E5B
MVLFFILGLVLLVVAALLITSALATDEEHDGVGKSLAVLEAMTTAPTELKSELDRPFAERVLEPLQARALTLGRRLSGNDSAERLRRKLDLAGNPGDWSPDRVISFKVIGAFSLTLLGLALALVMAVPVTILLVMTLGGLVLGFFTPDLYLYQTAYNRAEQIESTLPDAIDLLTISVEAGLAFDAALQQVARNTEGALAQEFSRVLREMQIGQSRSDALRALSERTNVDNLKTFVGAMVQADAFGIPIANVLRVQSSEMRVKRRQRAETKAQQVPVKMTVPLIFNVLPALFVAIIGPAILSVLGKF